MRNILPVLNRFYSDILIYLLIVISISCVFWQVHSFGFISLDDYMYVRDNPYIKQGVNLNSIKWAFTSFYAGNWHPLTWISHMLDVEIFGLNPGFHHMMNVLIHAVNSIILFHCMRRMTRNTWGSLFIALIFGLHPLHVESVAWISERKDVLSGFFWILSMLAYTRYVERSTAANYIIVTVCYTLGLMAKPMLVTLPFVLLLIDFWPLGRIKQSIQYQSSSKMKMVGDASILRKNTERSSKSTSQTSSPLSPEGNIRMVVLRLVMEKIPLLLISAAVSIITMFAQNSSGAISSLESIPLLIRIENALISYIMYIAKMFWPSHLAVFYPFPRMITLPMVLFSSAILSIVTFLVAANIRRFPYLFVGWFWYLGSLVPVIGIIQVGSQSMADRYTYVPLIGISIMIAWGLLLAAERWKLGRYLILTVCCVIFSYIMWSSWIYAGYWKDNVTLFSHAIDVTKDNYIAHNSLGVALCDLGDFDGGINHYREALRLNPVHVHAYNNLGAALVKKARCNESVNYFNKAIQIDPYFINAHYNLGIALDCLGKSGDAIKEYQIVLQLNPKHSGALQKIQSDIVRQSKINEAITQLNDALKSEPRNFIFHYRLAELYKGKGDFHEAIRHYEIAVSINHDLAPALRFLAILYGENREYDKALLALQRLAKLTPDDPDIYYNMACIYSKKGIIDNALKYLSVAMKKGFSNQMLLRTDPDLDNIRETQLYKQLITVNK